MPQNEGGCYGVGGGCDGGGGCGGGGGGSGSGVGGCVGGGGGGGLLTNQNVFNLFRDARQSWRHPDFLRHL